MARVRRVDAPCAPLLEQWRDHMRQDDLRSTQTEAAEQVRFLREQLEPATGTMLPSAWSLRATTSPAETSPPAPSHNPARTERQRYHADMQAIRHLAEPDPPSVTRDLRHLSGTGKAQEVIIPTLVRRWDDEGTDQQVDPLESTTLIDTGATLSCISAAMVTKLGLTPELGTETPCTHIQLASGKIPRLGHADVVLSACGTTAIVRLEVLADCDTDILLGMDLLSAFGCSVVLPEPMRRVGDVMEHLQADEDQSVEPPTTTFDLMPEAHRCSARDVMFVNQGIAATLQANKDLSAADHCTHPDATMRLHLKEGAQPSYVPQYRTPLAAKEFVNRDLSKWQADGVTRPVPRNVAWNSPIVAAPKKDHFGNKTDIRTCLDFRALNALTVDSATTVPHIGDLFERLRGFRYASALDLKSGYLQLKLHEASQEFTSFRWNHQARCFQRVPFGLKSTTTHFQRLMESIAEEAGCLARCVIYVDDIVLFSTSLEQHVSDLNSMIATLTKYKLRLNHKKCSFAYTRLRVLGFLLSGREKRVDKRKARDMLRIPRPASAKQMQSLLGLANFMRDHVPYFADVTASLEQLRNKKRICSSLER